MATNEKPEQTPPQLSIEQSESFGSDAEIQRAARNRYLELLPEDERSAEEARFKREDEEDAAHAQLVASLSEEDRLRYKEQLKALFAPETLGGPSKLADEAYFEELRRYASRPLDRE